MSPEQIVQAQIEAYNAQDLDVMCSHYTQDCVFAELNGAVRQVGKEAIRAAYAETFAKFPQDRAFVMNRIVVGDHVIDDEQVERSPGAERIKVASIYTIRDGLIARCDFAR